MSRTYDIHTPDVGTREWHRPLNDNFRRIAGDLAALDWRVTRLESGLSMDGLGTGYEYDRPEQGTTDWHVPLNENFEDIADDIAAIADRIGALDDGSSKSYDYRRPAAGATDWHVPLNENFRRISKDIAALDERVAALEDGTQDGIAVAVTSGSWHDEAVWGRDVPEDGDSVLIPEGTTVELSGETAALDWVRIEGTLRADPEADSHLRVDTVLTTDGSRLELGTKETPVDPDVEARITFRDTGPIDESFDPERKSRGLLVHGDLSVHGAPKTSWTSLAGAPRSGTRDLTLSESPTNWSSGDRVVVPGLSHEENQDEERTIAAVDGNTVRLDEPLEYDHVPPESDLDTYVLNLSRNVVFASESHDVMRRGHLMVMSTGTDIRYLETDELGRTDKSRPFTKPPGGRGVPEPQDPPNPPARYAIHFHRTGLQVDEHVVEGCAVRGSPGWGIVNHGSHADVLDCVTYRVFGAGIVAEKGNEVGRFAGNFALRSAGSGELVDDRELLIHNQTGKVHDPPNNIDDFGHGGHGFWMQSPAVEVEDNVAAGHRHHGFVYWLRSLVEDPSVDAKETLQSRRDMVPDFPVELMTEEEARAARTEDGLAFSSDFPIRLFRGNTCFACGGGMDFSRQQFRDSNFRYDEWGAIEDFTVYNVGKYETADGELLGRTGGAKSGGNVAVDVRLCANLAIRNCRFIGDGDGTAIWRTFPYTDSILVEDSEIVGWESGFVPTQFNGNNMENIVRNNYFDNDVDVEVRGRFNGDVAINGNTFADGGTAGIELQTIHPGNASARRVGIVDTGIEFDGRTVYYDVSDPDAVFVDSDTFLSKLKNKDRWAQDNFLGADASNLRGTTTQEVYDNYEVTIRGAVTPDSAEEHPLVEGGKVGPKSANKTQPTDEVWIDATDYEGTTNGAIQVVSDDRAADGQALRLQKPDRSHEDPPASPAEMATYRFEVSRDGLYYMEARLGASEHNGSRQDSLWIRIDEDEWHRWVNVAPRYMWHRYRMTAGSSGTQQPGADLRFDAGEHRIDIGGRGVEMFADKFLVRHATTGASAIADGRPPTE